VKAEPDAADDVFLVAQDDDGNFVGDTVLRLLAARRRLAGDPPTIRVRVEASWKPPASPMVIVGSDLMTKSPDLRHKP